MKLSVACIMMLSSSSLVAASPTPSPSAGGSSTQSKSSSPSTTRELSSGHPSTSTGSAHPSSTKSIDVDGTAYGWKHLDCKDPTATDEKMDGKKRWEEAGVIHAWGQGINAFDTAGGHGSFSKAMSDFLQGPVNAFCGEDLEDETNCETVPDCSNGAAHSFNTSAGYLLVRSMFTLNQAYRNMWTAFDQGKDRMNVAKLSNTFAPVSSSISHTKAMVDGIMMAFGVSVAPMWNKFFRSGMLSNNAVGTVKDSTNAIMSSSLTILKDLSKTGSALANIEKASDLIDHLHKTWTEGVSQLAKDMFSGSTATRGDLYNHIKDGQLLNMEDPAGVEDGDMDDAITAYSAFVIPELWQSDDLAPVVIDSEQGCDDVSDKWIRNWLVGSKDVKKFKACYDGRAYFLVSAPGTKAEGCRDDCDTVAFHSLPGASELDGKTWGKLKFEDIIIGSIRSYEKNNNKNGYEVGDFDEKVIEDIMEHEYTTAGVFVLPVCSHKEAGKNWWAHSNSGKGTSPKHYPCN